VNDLRLSIRQTYAAIGIDSEPAHQHMHMPQGDQQIQQPSAKMEFKTTPSQLSIDSSDAWHALGHGPNLEWSSAIYSQMKSIFLQQLAKQVEEGKRLADITNPRSAFADLAQDALFRPNPVDYQTVSPGYLNVHLGYNTGAVRTEIEASPVRLEYTPHKAEIEAQQGKLDIYLRQKNSIEISVVQYDLYK
jgi:hypothetical protein